MTTINSPNDRLLEWLVQHDWTVVVALDRRSDATAWSSVASDGLIVLTLEEQADRFGLFAQFVPFDTYARKNFGFLEAFRRGFQLVWELDDDNFPHTDPRTLLDHEWTALSPRSGHPLAFGPESTEQFIPLNLYPELYGEFCWPRGFPLRCLEDASLGSNSQVVEIISSDCPDIIQLGIDGEPDFDAIFRMGRASKVFKSNPIWLRLNHPFVAPCNTQNTLWRCFGDAARLGSIYHPFTVSDRFSDIMKGYVAQVFHSLGVGPSTVFQARNQHSNHADFLAEQQLYRDAYPLIAALSAFLEDEPVSVISVYSRLLEQGLIGSADISALEAFLQYVNE